MNSKDTKKVIVALDNMTVSEALKIAKTLQGLVWGYKVNDLLHEDSNIIKHLKKYGKVFADVKLYDIPNTVSNTVKKLSKHGADFITVHISGGIPMMQAAKKNSGKSKIIGVTVLTSNYIKSSTEVTNLVKMALKANIDGIVCSGNELKDVRGLIRQKSLITVVPGIRPKSYKAKDDQIRKVTPKEAIDLGANYLVIGRPITKSKNILKALEEL
ncbi:orotidine-5'-phosphate decarboxylase [Patescibacteria group bacterium]|nr:orotidine-5'-phosphate decarboxylase [Patescibacteria group bacterium]